MMNDVMREVAERIRALDLTAELTAVGAPWVEGDAAGNPVTRYPAAGEYLCCDPGYDSEDAG